MEISIMKDEKNELEVQINNQTIAELVRVYLNQDDSVNLGVWKREHYSKPVVMKIETEGKTAKKALHDAIAKAQKDLKKYGEEFKKSKQASLNNIAAINLSISYKTRELYK